MAAPADAIYVDGEVRTLGPAAPVEAVAVRNGRCCRLADTYEVEFLEGVETDAFDLAGRTVLPGFEAHVDLLGLGQRLGADGSAQPDRGTAMAGPATLAEARDCVDAALTTAARHGVTTLHAAVADPLVARAAWDHEAVPVRLRLHYGQRGSGPLLDAVRRLGLTAGAGGPRRSIETLGVRVASSALPDGRPWIAPDGVPDFLATASDAGVGVTLQAVDERALDAAIEGLAESAPESARLLTDLPLAPTQHERLEAAGTVVVLEPGAWAQNERPPIDAIEDPGRHLRLSAGPTDVDPLGLLDTLVREWGVSTNTALRVLTGTQAAAPAIEVGAPADFLVLSDALENQPTAALDVDLTVSDGRVVGGSV